MARDMYSKLINWMGLQYITCH